jgi:hypothetical protein
VDSQTFRTLEAALIAHKVIYPRTVKTTRATKKEK